MPAESAHHRAPKQRYTIVVLPASETGTTRHFRIGIAGLVALGVGVFIFVAAVLLAALVYTPLGVFIPIPNPELESRYNREILAIQQQLRIVTEDLLFLREYNFRLRKALGEDITQKDSAFIAGLDLGPQTDWGVMNEMLRSGTEPVERTELAAVAPVAFHTVQAELPLILPASGYITQEFDAERQHLGMDIAGKQGSIVSAATDGTVIFAGWTYDDGYMIMIAHGGGYRTIYKHNQTLLKPAGAYVRRGEPIALLGNSGRTSLGPHLHFELWKDGIPYDPREFLLTTQ